MASDNLIDKFIKVVYNSGTDFDEDGILDNLLDAISDQDLNNLIKVYKEILED